MYSTSLYVKERWINYLRFLHVTSTLSFWSWFFNPSSKVRRCTLLHPHLLNTRSLACAALRRGCRPLITADYGYERHRSKSVFVGWACCRLGWMAVLFVKIAPLKQNGALSKGILPYILFVTPLFASSRSSWFIWIFQYSKHKERWINYLRFLHVTSTLSFWSWFFNPSSKVRRCTLLHPH